MTYDSNNTPVISVERMRRSDAYTIANHTESKTLMYRAAKGIYDSYDWKNSPVYIVTGSGNNGGDGYALAMILAEKGIKSSLVRLTDRFSDDGRYYYEKAIQLGVDDFIYSCNTEFEKNCVIVDCIFGTGFKGKPEGVSAKAIEQINSADAYVISADINSGINGDTGEAELAVCSDLTVSIGFLKKGMFLADAPRYIGKLVNVDIGIILV